MQYFILIIFSIQSSYDVFICPPFNDIHNLFRSPFTFHKLSFPCNSCSTLTYALHTIILLDFSSPFHFHYMTSLIHLLQPHFICIPFFLSIAMLNFLTTINFFLTPPPTYTTYIPPQHSYKATIFPTSHHLAHSLHPTHLPIFPDTLSLSLLPNSLTFKTALTHLIMILTIVPITKGEHLIKEHIKKLEINLHHLSLTEGWQSVRTENRNGLQFHAIFCSLLYLPL